MPTVDQIRHRITRPTAMTSTADGRDHLLSQQATTVGLGAATVNTPRSAGVWSWQRPW